MAVPKHRLEGEGEESGSSLVIITIGKADRRAIVQLA
jgi:hypothetical protein